MSCNIVYMNSIGGALIVFGGIFFVMSLIIYLVMKKEVLNPNCMDEVMSVKTTKRNQKILFFSSLIMVVAGIIMMMV